MDANDAGKKRCFPNVLQAKLHESSYFGAKKDIP